MTFLMYGGAAVLISGELAVLICAFKCKRPLGALLLNSALGIAALLALRFSDKLIGIHISVNLPTVLGSAAFGLPGVCGLLLLPLIFGV